jgi:hypothetical protein
LLSEPCCGELITTLSPGSRPEPSGWMMPVPVERIVPVGTSFERRSQSTRSGSLRFSCDVEALPLNTSVVPRDTTIVTSMP